MRITFWNWVGGYLGILAARWVLFQTVYVLPGGEASIAASIEFLLGGWMKIPLYYALGAAIGFAVFPLLVESAQIMAARVQEHLQNHRRT